MATLKVHMLHYLIPNNQEVAKDDIVIIKLTETYTNYKSSMYWKCESKFEQS